MSNFQDTIAELGTALGITDYTIADHSMIPRAIAIAAADLLDVDFEDSATATDIALTVVEDIEGTVPSHNPSVIAPILLRLVREHKDLEATIIGKTLPTNLNRFNSQNFQAARKKIEAVNRISTLTNSGPETLGPGSKERKSVLVNLGSHLTNWTSSLESLPKDQLARWIIHELGGQWSRRYSSTGQTITNAGLNEILRLAEPKFGSATNAAEIDIEKEANSYVAVIAEALNCATKNDHFRSIYVDGRESVAEMFLEDYAHKNQTEWFGWYAELKVLPALIRNFNGGPRKIHNTVFDYAGLNTWDLKTHTVAPDKRQGQKDWLILNDAESIDVAVNEGGLGFLVITGTPDFNGYQEFDQWHRRQRGAKPRSDKKNPRKLKVGVQITGVQAYLIEDFDELEKAKADSIISIFHQGRQASGQARQPKYKLDLNAAFHSQLCKASLS